MSATAGRSFSWSVGRYTATLTVPPPRPGHVASAVVTWDPHVPQRLTPEEVREYRAGRTTAIQRLGMNALVIDL